MGPAETSTLSEVYRSGAAAVAALFRTASPEQVATTVPGCPQWSARDLLAHLAGASRDILDGRMHDAPSPTWTARHIGERAGTSVPDLVAELLTNADEVAAGCVAGDGPSPAWDITVHLGDVREAWSRPDPATGREPASSAVVADALGFLVSTGQRFGSIQIDDGTWFGDLSGVPTRVRSDYELGRALFGRRTRREITSAVVEGDPEAVIEAAFFAVPDDDARR